MTPLPTSPEWPARVMTDQGELVFTFHTWYECEEDVMVWHLDGFIMGPADNPLTVKLDTAYSPRVALDTQVTRHFDAFSWVTSNVLT